jgi:poly(3-hydroxybutyrate) depolymerase
MIVLDYGDDLLRENPNHVNNDAGEEDSEEELDDVETLVAGVEKTTLDD